MQTNQIARRQSTRLHGDLGTWLLLWWLLLHSEGGQERNRWERERWLGAGSLSHQIGGLRWSERT